MNAYNRRQMDRYSERAVKSMSLILILCIVAVIGFAAGQGYERLIKRVTWIDEGRAEAIEDVNSLLRSQAYSIKFRIGEHGTALVFPAPTRKSIYIKWENHYNKKEINRP